MGALFENKRRDACKAPRRSFAESAGGLPDLCARSGAALTSCGQRLFWSKSVMFMRAFYYFLFRGRVEQRKQLWVWRFGARDSQI